MKKELNYFYVVKKNETIEEIAKLYNLSPIEILISNKITPLMVKEGKILFIKKDN